MGPSGYMYIHYINICIHVGFGRENDTPIPRSEGSVFFETGFSLLHEM